MLSILKYLSSTRIMCVLSHIFWIRGRKPSLLEKHYVASAKDIRLAWRLSVFFPAAEHIIYGHTAFKNLGR
jgi:hypothetical protein